MKRETATHTPELPHEFEPALPAADCRLCGAHEQALLHTAAAHPEQQARESAHQALVVQKGT